MIVAAKESLYVPTQCPQDYDAGYLYSELLRLAAIIDQLQQGAYAEQHAAPAKPRDGTLAFADGTDWNPGDGQGMYEYRGGWYKMGGGAITFLNLTDTPSSYSGQANKVVSVNGAGNALEFTTAGAGDVSNPMVANLDADNYIIFDVTFKRYSESVGTATSSSGTLTVNLNNGNFQRYTMTENITTIDFTNVPTGVIIPVALEVTQHASAAKTMDFDTITAKIDGTTKTMKASEGVGPAIPSDLGGENLFSFLIDPASNKITVFVGGTNFS